MKNIFNSLNFALVFKLLFGISLFYLIYSQLSAKWHTTQSLQSISFHNDAWFLFCFAFILMFCNWGIESYKWQSITSQIEPLTYSTACKSQLTGICIGNLSPGRSMEFLAKIYFFKKDNRPTAALLHFINGLFQMTITIIMGVLGLCFKITNHSISRSNNIYFVFVLVALFIIFISLVFNNVSWLQKKIFQFKWYQKRFKTSNQINLNFKLVFKLLQLSLLRYLVFSIQFYLIYFAISSQFNFNLSFMGSVSVYFMLTSLVPMISFLEPFIRTAIALFVFSDNNIELNLLLVTTIFWLFNIVIPSIMGYIIILKEKIVLKKQPSI